jgi:hypothetical protein
MSKDDSYSRIMGPYVKYWESILELLTRPIPRQNSILLESFWYSCNWRTYYERASIPIIVDVDTQNPVIPPYCGLKHVAFFEHYCMHAFS